MNKFFKNLKDKVDSFYSTEGTDLDKDIFINSDQRLLKIASSIIVLTSFLGIGWLAVAKTDEIIIVPGKIIPIGKVKEIKMPMSGVIEKIEIKEGLKEKFCQSQLYQINIRLPVFYYLKINFFFDLISILNSIFLVLLFESY